MKIKKLFILLAAACFLPSFGQNMIDSLETSKKIKTLKKEFSTNKEILPSYELETLLALSYYPELAKAHIKFKHAKIKTTLNARPTFGSVLLREKKNRKYVIRINKRYLDSIIHFDNLSFNTKTALFGHEFAHIYDYQNRNFWGITSRLIAYSSKKSKAKFEKEIDAITIQRGLGWQLLEWSDYVLNKSDATKAYKTFKRAIYLTPNEIKLQLNRY